MHDGVLKGLQLVHGVARQDQRVLLGAAQQIEGQLPNGRHAGQGKVLPEGHGLCGKGAQIPFEHAEIPTAVVIHNRVGIGTSHGVVVVASPQTDPVT